MGINFTERCSALFNRVVKSLLWSLHGHPVGLLMCKDYLLECWYFRKFHAQSPLKTRHMNIYQRSFISWSAGLTNRCTVVVFLWYLLVTSLVLIPIPTSNFNIFNFHDFSFCVRFMSHITRVFEQHKMVSHITQYRASVNWEAQATQGDDKYWNNTPAITVFTQHQIVVQQRKENWRRFNNKLWSNWLKLSNGDAHRSI